MSDAVCSLNISGRWDELSRCAFLNLNYHNPENLVFQHLPVKDRINISFKNQRLERIKRTRNGIIMDSLTSVDMAAIIKCGGSILEVFEGFFCHNLDYNPYTEIVTDMFGKRDFFKSLGRDLLQNLAKNLD